MFEAESNLINYENGCDYFMTHERIYLFCRINPVSAGYARIYVEGS